MNLTSKLLHEIRQLAPLQSDPPHPVTVRGTDSTEITIDVTVAESLGCSFRQIVLRSPQLNGAAIDVLKRWAAALSQRVTYLMEGIGPLEVDADAGQILIRSTPPGKRDDGTRFYEILLESQAAGNFTLRRYESIAGQSGRSQVDVNLTHEVLDKLVSDLVDTIPQ